MWDFAAFRGFLKYAELRTICCCPDSLIAPRATLPYHSLCPARARSSHLHTLAALLSTRAIETRSRPRALASTLAALPFMSFSPNAPFPYSRRVLFRFSQRLRSVFATDTAAVTAVAAAVSAAIPSHAARAPLQVFPLIRRPQSSPAATTGPM